MRLSTKTADSMARASNHGKTKQYMAFVVRATISTETEELFDQIDHKLLRIPAEITISESLDIIHNNIYTLLLRLCAYCLFSLKSVLFYI